MKKHIYKILLALSIVTFSGCDLDLQDSPNVLAPDATDPDFMLNGLVINLGTFFNGATDIGMEVMRMENLGGTTWDDAFTATDFDAIWTDAYADILVEARVLQDVATEKGLFHHRGISMAIQAYTMVTLVDFFAEVPYSEAFDAGNLSPNVDGGQSIYNEALVILDSALVNLGKEPLSDADELIYGGDATLWTTMVKTLQLRIHLQKALVDNSASVSAINALLAEDDLIDTDAEAFSYKYGTTASDPDSRHPDFSANYTGGAAEYMSNSYMDLLFNDKAIVDPRMRYYFYRQSTGPANVTERECDGAAAPFWYSADDVFCTIGSGYWGRDHLDNNGIPPDTQKRTIYGIYPVGGAYDNDDFVLGGSTDGLAGAGIQPIIMPAFTEFMKAEAALSFAATGDPRVSLEAGIRASMASVEAISTPGGAPAMVAADIDAYVNEVLANYDAATSTAEQLEIIITEFYIALWGNGVDAYNTYRRTGYPANLQPGVITENIGDFYRSFIYPASLVNRNSAVDQKATNTQKVFWDNNPDGFVD